MELSFAIRGIAYIVYLHGVQNVDSLSVTRKITFSILVFETSHDLLNLLPDMNKAYARYNFIRTVFVLLNLSF